MIKLLVDTSGKEIGVGLFDGGKKIYEEYVHSERNYNKKIIPLLDKAIQAGKINITDIDLFGATLGPGSFTGIRVGVAVMRALSQALNKKFFGVPVPDILVTAAQTDGEKVVLMEAGRGEFYFTKYSHDNKINAGNYQLLNEKDTISSIKNKDIIIFLQYDLFVKEFVEKKLKNNTFITFAHIDMCVFGDIIEKNGKGSTKNLNLQPVYVRMPDAEKNLKRKKHE